MNEFIRLYTCKLIIYIFIMIILLHCYDCLRNIQCSCVCVHVTRANSREDFAMSRQIQTETIYDI